MYGTVPKTTQNTKDFCPLWPQTSPGKQRKTAENNQNTKEFSLVRKDQGCIKTPRKRRSGLVRIRHRIWLGEGSTVQWKLSPLSPGSLKALLFPPLVNKVQSKGTQGVRARYDAELHPFISLSGTPVVQSYWAFVRITSFDSFLAPNPKRLFWDDRWPRNRYMIRCLWFFHVIRCIRLHKLNAPDVTSFMCRGNFISWIFAATCQNRQEIPLQRAITTTGIYWQCITWIQFQLVWFT